MFLSVWDQKNIFFRPSIVSSEFNLRNLGDLKAAPCTFRRSQSCSTLARIEFLTFLPWFFLHFLRSLTSCCLKISRKFLFLFLFPSASATKNFSSDFTLDVGRSTTFYSHTKSTAILEQISSLLKRFPWAPKQFSLHEFLEYFSIYSSFRQCRGFRVFLRQ